MGREKNMVEIKTITRGYLQSSKRGNIAKKWKVQGTPLPRAKENNLYQF